MGERCRACYGGIALKLLAIPREAPRCAPLVVAEDGDLRDLPGHGPHYNGVSALTAMARD